MNNIFKNEFNYFNINIIDASNIDFEINLYNDYIYIYDKYLVNNNLYNNSNIKYEINNIINIDNIIDILNIINYNFNNYYHIYNECIVNNTYYLKNINHTEYKSPYLFNSFRIFDKNGNYIYNQTYVQQEQNISIIPINQLNYNKICFYIDHSWSYNHHCQFIELMPTLILCKKIINDNKYDITKIDFIINYIYKDIYNELFEIFNIDKSINKIYVKKIPEDINEYYFQYNIIYNFGIISNHRNANHPLFHIFTKYLNYYFTYKSTNNIFNSNGIALLRDSHNNNNTWSERCISNNDELVSCLKEKNIEIINTEKLSLFEKFCKLSYRNFIIIESGASMPNLYFIEKLENTKIILLCNENMYNFHGIYEDQIRYYYKNVQVIICNMTNKDEAKCNINTNRPFIVNVNEIMNSII
jgi:hypothetical protein